MALTVLDATVAAALAAAPSQVEQIAAMLAPWSAGADNVIVKIYDGATLRDTVTLAPWAVQNSPLPRRIVAGNRLSRTHSSAGAFTRVVFATASADIFELTAGVGSGDLQAYGNIRAESAPRFNGVSITANTALFAGGDWFVNIWGQSNAVGLGERAELADPPLDTDPGLATFGAGTFSRVYIWTGSAFEQLQPSTNAQAWTLDDIGPEFGLAVRWMRETASGNLYLMKRAWSSQSITQFAPGVGTRYLSSIPEHGQAIDWFTANAVNIIGRGFIWVQGESDSAQTQSWYQDRLEDLLDALLVDGVRTATSKVLLAQMHPTTDQYGAGVYAAKAAYVAANPTFASDPLMPAYMNTDNLHQSARGQLQMGYDYFSTIFSAPQLNT